MTCARFDTQAEEELLTLEGVTMPAASYSDNSECLRMLDSHLGSVLCRAPSPAPSSLLSRSTSPASVDSASSLSTYNPSLTEWKLRRNSVGGFDSQARWTHCVVGAGHMLRTAV